MKQNKYIARLLSITLVLLMIPNLVACDYSDLDVSQKETAANSVIKEETSESSVKVTVESPLFSKLKVGQTIKYGFYEQDNKVDKSSKNIDWENRTLEPIEWIVLDVKNDKALVISKYALDCVRYDDTGHAVTWETCGLRPWLNSIFFERAFGSYDHDIIASTKLIENPINAKYGDDGTDKVFLLSVSEAKKYFKSNKARKCLGTAYCYAEGAVGNVGKAKENWCVWWLRSTKESNLVPYVDYNGSIPKKYECGDSLVYAVRPAMWIYLDQ